MSFRAVVSLCGGVGGARLLHGLSQVLPAGALTAIVNTGDDFRHWGLEVSPDLDTCMYTLAGLADEARGWGLLGDTFRARDAMQRLGREDWFALGDGDLATHLYRSEALAAGRSLTEVTHALCARLGVTVPLLPMSDAPLRTWLDTPEHGSLPFQEWLVKVRAPRVSAVRFVGAAQPTPGVLEALEQADVVIIGPSNPYVSIDPILSLPGVRARLAQKRVVALSPIVAGRAVKGPLAEMLQALAGAAPSAALVCAHYGTLLAGYMVEHGDERFEAPCVVRPARTVMGGSEDRARLARELLALAESLP